MRRIVQFVPVVATALVSFLVPPACTVAEVSQVPGTWTTAAPLPDKRTEVSMTSDGGRLYLLGGFGPGTNSASAPRAVYAYSPSIDDWTPLTQLPASGVRDTYSGQQVLNAFLMQPTSQQAPTGAR